MRTFQVNEVNVRFSRVDEAEFEIDPELSTPEAILAYLDSRIQDVVTELQATELWKVFTSPATSPELMTAILREIYLEIIMYQPDVIEATIATISQLPRTMDISLIEEMLHHQVEEFSHGEMALRDYVALSGDEQFARNCRMSPTSFATAATWRMICHQRDPFAYLGAIYPFEGLTPIVTAMAKELLEQRDQGGRGCEFIDYHSTADLEHTKLVKDLILRIATEYPESKPSICYGLEYFLASYPLPGWQAAYRRALRKG